MPQESLNAITSLLAEQLDRTGDEPFKRSLALRVDAWRSTILQRSLEKHPQQRKTFLQTLWVPMQKSSLVPCQIPLVLCPVAQSTCPVPTPLRGTIRYDYLGGIDGNSPFPESAVGTQDYLLAGRYSKNTIFYEMVNGLISIRANSNLPMIRIDGVFDKPLDVFKYNCECSNTDCDYWNRSYPVTGDILQSIIQYILQIDYNRQDNSVPKIGVNEKP